MSGRPPNEIWQEGLDEGERRMRRNLTALGSTGLAGGVDVMLGIVAVVVSTAALSVVLPTAAAHLLGSLTFGLAIVFITIGRSELFTENFLIPVGAVMAKRCPTRDLARMWAVTFVLNLVALAALCALLVVKGVLDRSTLVEAGRLADVYTTRTVTGALVSAVFGGLLMTLFTWLSIGAESASARVLIALIVGFLLAAPSLNHAVVSFGEVLLGIFAGTSTSTYGELAANLGLATIGNLLGGVGFVTLLRVAQVTNEPAAEGSGAEVG